MISENRELGFKVIFADSDYDSFIERVDYEDLDTLLDESKVDVSVDLNVVSDDEIIFDVED